MMFVNRSIGTYQFEIKGAPSHEFLGKPFDFKQNSEISDLERRINKNVRALKQVHGDVIVDLTSVEWNPNLSGDGLFSLRKKASDIALGVFTADCLPILMWNETAIAALHAGWRGVASGIIEKGVELFDSREPLTIIIGPAAGGNAYEVGDEVVREIGKDAVVKKGDGRLFLDLASTASQKIKKFSHVQAHTSNLCTITNTSFHSHRRDGLKRGSNFSWISGS